MGDALVLDAARTNPGVCCGTCREKRHKFSFAPGWQQGDGCPCCWNHAGPFLLRFICCGRDDGTCTRSTWEEADALRESYISAEGHDRSCIIEKAP